MAFKTQVITITTSPTLISNPNPSGRDGHTVYLQNISTTIDIAIGGSDVTYANGYFMHRASSATLGDDLQIKVLNGESLYAITTSGTLDIRVMWSGA
jgi:hypothetical protein